MKSKKLKFNKDGKFVILQVSDPQDMHYVRHTMFRMLNKAYDRINPDLVVFTGDNILGNHLRDARFGSKHDIHTKEEEFARMEKAISFLLKPLQKKNLPFTMIYGNHDDMNEITKDEQADIYRSYPNCYGLDNPDKSVDVDTFNLPVYSKNGDKKIFNLWFMDSAWKDKKENMCHTGVKKEAVEWYERTSHALKEENGKKPMPSIMFQHIAMPESACLMEDCEKSSSGAIPFFRDGDTPRYVRLNPKKADGVIGEPIVGYKENNGQLEALKRCGDVKAVVYGHEHYNNFVGEHDGIKIYQSSCASFRCYGNRLRGVRVIEISEYEPENIKTYFLTYSDLCGDGIFSKVQYIWDADGCAKQKGALIAATAAIGLSTAAAGIYLRRKINGKFN